MGSLSVVGCCGDKRVVPRYLLTFEIGIGFCAVSQRLLSSLSVTISGCNYQRGRTKRSFVVDEVESPPSRILILDRSDTSCSSNALALQKPLNFEQARYLEKYNERAIPLRRNRENNIFFLCFQRHHYAELVALVD